MIAPGAIVGDVHAFFALAGGFDEGAIAVEDGFVEELGRLPLPDFEANFVNGVAEIADIGFGEAAAEIASGAGTGDAGRVESIEVDGVVAAQFKILDAGAAAHDVVGNIEDMIGLVIGHMHLEQVQTMIDGLGEAELLGHEMDGAEAAIADGTTAFAEFVMDITGSELRPIAAWQPSFIQPALDATLAIGPDAVYFGSHSKSLLASGA